MNILLDPLPCRVEVGGVFYGINPDFRVMVRLELRALEGEGIWESLNEFYLEMPEDAAGALVEMVRFYRCYGGVGSGGKNRPDTSRHLYKEGRHIPVYSFEADAGRIYSAFWQQYGIDLCETECLHWFKFRNMFLSLAEDTEIVRVMQYRGTDLNGIRDRDMKEFYRARQKEYAIPLTKTEREQLRAIERALEGSGDLDGII